jgi:uncharacterized protein YabN with tetrapyrrole methylase and pyrophosphatase domain
MSRTHIDIVGFGIGGVPNITLGTNGIIVEADRVFTLVASTDLADYLEAVGKSNVDLSDCYDSERTAEEVYDAIVQRIIEQSEGYRHIAVVVDGNPQLYNTPVRRLREVAKQLNWEVVVHPAVSSLDTILIDLDLSISETGLQVFDSGRMVARRIPPDPRVGCLLLQLAACSVPTFIPVTAQTTATFDPLRKWLLEYYSANHRFIIIRTAIGVSDRSKLVETTIGGFPEHAKEIDYYCSAYIPPYYA